MTADAWLTVTEVAEEFRTTGETVRRWIARGRLKALKEGQTIRIRRAWVDEFIDAQTVGGDQLGRRRRTA